jgi:hypothetical protein
VEDAHKYKMMMEAKLTEWQADFINLDSINEDELLINLQDVDPWFESSDWPL